MACQSKLGCTHYRDSQILFQSLDVHKKLKPLQFACCQVSLQAESLPSQHGFKILSVFYQVNSITSNFFKPLSRCEKPTSSIPHTCGDISLSYPWLRHLLSPRLLQSLFLPIQFTFPNISINLQFQPVLKIRIPTTSFILLLHPR